ncbi:MAG: hypothetical protein HRU15_11975, partial [Planctomycetes bacterium]|nr:hypothetical protein [Planctomycetota bacterium]
MLHILFQAQINRLLIVLLSCSFMASNLLAVELQPIRYQKLKIKAPLDPRHSVDDIQSASFFITRDNGGTWSVVEKKLVHHQAGFVPYFIFTSQGDGSYGFWTQVHYSDGSSDKAPLPGTLPFLKV